MCRESDENRNVLRVTHRVLLLKLIKKGINTILEAAVGGLK